VRWPRVITAPGRVIDEFVNFTDLAPTILDAAGISLDVAAMQPITGRSLRGLLAGEAVPQRDHVLVGKERTDVGRPHDAGYPIRGIATADYLYLKNYEPSRWPAGNPETGYLDTDGSPTKSLILQMGRADRTDHFWRLNFGLRPSEELYDLANDPDCARNIATESSQADRVRQLRERMETELRAQGDPRMAGRGSVFDDYVPTAGVGFYERYLRGEKPQAGWVNETDFEKEPLQP